MEWVGGWIPCKRRLPQTETPSPRKIAKISLPAPYEAAMSLSTPLPVSLPSDSSLAYKALVTTREASNASLLTAKIRVLKTVLRRAEVSSIQPGKERIKAGSRGRLWLSEEEEKEVEE